MADLKFRIGHSTKTALCNEVYVVCTYLSCLLLQAASEGNASLSFLNALTKTTPTEPILRRIHDRGSRRIQLANYNTA